MKPALQFIQDQIDCNFECKEDMILSLKSITDNDYNGNNEEQNKISCLESIVNEMYDKFATKEVIEAVIKDNYCNNSYYWDCEYAIIDTIDDLYHVVIATLS